MLVIVLMLMICSDESLMGVSPHSPMWANFRTRLQMQSIIHNFCMIILRTQWVRHIINSEQNKTRICIHMADGHQRINLLHGPDRRICFRKLALDLMCPHLQALLGTETELSKAQVQPHKNGTWMHALYLALQSSG